MLYFTTFKTHFCNITVVGNEDGLRNLYLDTGDGKSTFRINESWKQDRTPFGDAIEQIQAYCHGELEQFTLPLILEGTDFQKKVWGALCEIPYGEVRTYGEIAERIGNKKASRAVGMANSKNPIPLIVPCHRVIGANGTLTGFAHGLAIKQNLLQLEGVTEL